MLKLLKTYFYVGKRRKPHFPDGAAQLQRRFWMRWR